MQANDLTSPNDAFTVPSVVEADPAGGISRGEAAELVAIDVEYHAVEIDQNLGTQADGAATGVRGMMEISLEDDPIQTTQNRTQVDFGGGENEGDEVATLSRQIISDSPDSLYVSRSRADGARDVTNGMTYLVQGDGGHGSGTSKHFRDFAGRGPVLLARDEWYVHGRLNVIDNDSLNVVQDLGWRMYWKIHDREDVL